MAIAWAITSENKLRSTWGDAAVVTPILAAAGYPGTNIIDGNRESKWVADGSGSKVIKVDSGDASLDIDYLCLWFDIGVTLPTLVKIETSPDDAVYTGVVNQYDGTVTTTTTAALDGTSRIVPVADVTGISAGTSITIVGGGDQEYYLVVSVGANYVEIDRLPLAFSSGVSVRNTVEPVILVAIGAGESDRYIKLTITGYPAHLCEVQGFKVTHLFGGDDLPLNPYPAQQTINAGGVAESFAGDFIGKMQTGPHRSQFTVAMGRLYRDAIRILEWTLRQDRVGILMDDGTWWEVMPVGQIQLARRPSTDANLVSYASQVTFQEV